MASENMEGFEDDFMVQEDEPMVFKKNVNDIMGNIKRKRM